MSEFFDDSANSVPDAIDIFRRSPVVVFTNEKRLEEAISLLNRQEYELHECNCKSWNSYANLLDYCIGAGMIPDDAARNRNAFYDYMGWHVPEASFVWVFKNYDHLIAAHPEDAQFILDLIAEISWFRLTAGGRYFCLVHCKCDLLHHVQISLDNEPGFLPEHFWKKTEERIVTQYTVKLMTTGRLIDELKFKRALMEIGVTHFPCMESIASGEGNIRLELCDKMIAVKVMRLCRTFGIRCELL